MAAYGALVSLKQELGMFLNSHQHLSSEDKCRVLLRRLHLTRRLLRRSLRSQYFLHRRRIGEITSSVKEDWEILFHREEFHTLYEKIRSMDLEFRSHLGDVYFRQGRVRGVVFSLRKDLEFLCHKDHFHKLHDSVCLLDSLLKDSSRKDYDREFISKLHVYIRDLAVKAQNLIYSESQEEFLVQFNDSSWDPSTLSRPWHVCSKFDPTLLPPIIQDLDKINRVLKIRNNRIRSKRKRKHVIYRGTLAQETTVVTQKLRDPTSPTGNNSSDLAHPSRRSPRKDDKLVGLEKDLEKLLDSLTGVTSDFQVFPVTGMAGIGKTTFAMELYQHPLVMHRFDVRAWVTVSQEYQLRGMLLGLISCVSNSVSNVIFEMSEGQLREHLYRSLKGKKYLIVLDDVWDKQVWDDLKRVFPNDNNGSRALLTSRLTSVAIHASPNIPPYCLQFLSPEESWKLLCLKIFEEQEPPMELIPIGKQIAHKCRGLPLAIVLVGGLLSVMKRTPEVWEEVRQNVGSLVMDDTQYCQNILALSYNHLPDPLKACFLYTGVFPEDYEISCKKLIYLWIAEGFVRPKKHKTLEEVAEGYLEELIDRCIIMVKRKRLNGKIKTCNIHDLMRDYCLRESQKVNFFRVIHKFEEPKRNIHSAKKHYQKLLEKDLRNQQRLSFYSNIQIYMQHRPSFPFTHSFFCFEALRPIDLKGSNGIFFKLLKILDLMHVHLLSLPPGVLLLSNLKFLALTIVNPFPLSQLSELPRLETCIIDGELSGFVFRVFLSMTKLRHFHFRRILPQSFHHVFAGLKRHLESGNNTFLPNLQSLSTISSACCLKIFLRLPKLRTLAIYGTEEDREFLGWFKNLVYLRHLNTLKYAFSNPFASPAVKPDRLPAYNLFPPNLMKLTLSGTSFPWEDMRQLSLLPKLEVLKLKNYAFLGAVWRLEEQCFNCLKFLLIGSTNLEVWEADDSHFPSLENLVLRHCRSLKEIPYGIVDAPLLEKIELHCCAKSATTSAKELQKNQQELGNELITFYITQM